MVWILNISHDITWLSIGPQATDTTTLIPFLKDMQEHLSFKYQKIVADAGYESEENYLYIEKNEQLAFIKPANYEISKTRKYQNDIGRIENMEYDTEADCYTCKNGKRLTVTGVKKEKTKTGYQREKTLYSCEDCSGCPYKSECIKGNNCKTPLEERTKHLQVSKRFNDYRQKDLERILSGRLSTSDEPEYPGRRFFWGTETGHGVPTLSKQRDTECTGRKCTVSYGT